MMVVSVQGDDRVFAPCCERMATVIVEILKDHGECRPEDLWRYGFTAEEIEMHWRMAYALAKVELNWMDG